MGSLIKTVIFLAIIGAGVKYFILAEKSDEDIIVDVAVRKINEQRGNMVDKVTLLKGAYESSRGLVINYQLIDYQRIGFDLAEFREMITENAKAQNCGKRDITDVLAMGIEVTYVYYDAFDKKIAETVLNKNSCR